MTAGVASAISIDNMILLSKELSQDTESYRHCEY